MIVAAVLFSSFESAWVIWCGLPLLAAVMGWFYWRLRAAQQRQLRLLAALRGVALLLLVLLASRPIWSSSERSVPPRDHVVLLVDDSESMSLEHRDGVARYRAAVDFARERLLPVLQREGLRGRALLFSSQVRPATGQAVADAAPTGKSTDLAQAIVAAVTEGDQPPLAVVALTDGVSTVEQDNHRAATALLENGVPFIGLGFGNDQGPRVVTLRGINAPSRVPPNAEFRVEASVQAAGEGEFPPLELVLLRDGKFVERKTLKSLEGARLVQESFAVQEREPGRHQYTARILPAADDSVRLSGAEASTMVTIAKEEHWRVLFVQGGLTWDYKFIQLAVRKDPALKITGLSRTSSESRFFQSVEVGEDVLNGFPTTMDQLAEFRVVVLANLKPADLQPSQQQLLVKFCGEYGGGVLMLGGAETFNLTWRGSALEQLLPVRFAGTPSGRTSSGFALQPTSEALRHPVFQITDAGDQRAAWNRVPKFQELAEVADLKAGAEVWAVQGGAGSEQRPLIISQRFGSGRTTAICVPNMWKWRLARDSDTSHFDRFWQQLLRHLGGGDLQAINMHLVDQWLTPNTDLRVTLEQRPQPQGQVTVAGQYRFVVQNAANEQVLEQQVELPPGRPVEVTFQVPTEGVYALRVYNSDQVEQGNRTVEIKDLDREFVRTARDLDKLRQWAQLSRGEAIAAEDCGDLGELLERLRKRAAEAYRERPVHKPAGIDLATLAVLLGLLSTEWMLRRKWDWV